MVLSIFHRLKGVVDKGFSGAMSEAQPFMQSRPHSDSPGGVIDSNSSCPLQQQRILTQPKANDQYAALTNEVISSLAPLSCVLRSSNLFLRSSFTRRDRFLDACIFFGLLSTFSK